MGRSVAVLSLFCLHGQKSAGLLGLHFTVAGCCSQPDETVRCLVRVQSVARGERISLLFWASQHRFVQQVVEKAEQRAPLFFHFDGSPPAGFIKYSSDFVRRQKAHEPWGIVRRNHMRRLLGKDSVRRPDRGNCSTQPKKFGFGVLFRLGISSRGMQPSL